MIEITKDQFADLTDALINEGMIHGEDDARSSYSGRYMYGTGCIGFVTDSNPFEFGMCLARVIAMLNDDNLDDDEYESLDVEDFYGLRTDNMGRSMIVYFPGVSVSVV